MADCVLPRAEINYYISLSSIVFDECHKAKNLWTGSSSGGGKPTKTGLTVMELQKQLPNARIVSYFYIYHSVIRGVVIQSYSSGAKNFTIYVFCHPEFSGVIQNIENRFAILTPVCQCRLLSKESIL